MDSNLIVNSYIVFLLNNEDVSTLFGNQNMSYVLIKMHLLNYINSNLDYLAINKIGGESWTLVVSFKNTNCSRRIKLRQRGCLSRNLVRFITTLLC